MDNRIYRAPIEIHQNRCSKGYSSYAFANSVRRRRTYGQRQLLRAHFWDAFVATNDNTMGTARRLSASHRPTDPRPLHAFVTCTLGSARRAATAEIMDCHDAADNRLEDVDISTNRILHCFSTSLFFLDVELGWLSQSGSKEGIVRLIENFFLDYATI